MRSKMGKLVALCDGKKATFNDCVWDIVQYTNLIMKTLTYVDEVSGYHDVLEDRNDIPCEPSGREQVACRQHD